jgi:hypothetical protein
MYSKEEVAVLRKDFWTSLGLFMKPILSSEYEKINWVNYNTGVKGISFKLVANQKEAYLIIEIKTKDVEIKNLLFDQFLEFKGMFEVEVGDDWEWSKENFNEFDQERALIKSPVVSTNIYNKMGWDVPFNFFKKNLIAFDVFWENPKLVFKDLVK